MVCGAAAAPRQAPFFAFFYLAIFLFGFFYLAKTLTPTLVWGAACLAAPARLSVGGTSPGGYISAVASPAVMADAPCACLPPLTSFQTSLPAWLARAVKAALDCGRPLHGLQLRAPVQEGSLIRWAHAASCCWF